jgi:hypothetical protein
MANKLSMAKSVLAVSLGNLRARRMKVEGECAVKQRELEGIDHEIAAKLESVHRIDEAISANALLMEQISSIDPELLSKSPLKRPMPGGEGRRPHAIPSKDDPSILRLEDVREFFRDHPEPPPGKTGWSAAAILEYMPAEKQAHGKSYLPSALTTEKNAGKLRLVERGLYLALE